MIDEILIFAGGALLGNMIMLLYNRLNTNGITKLEKEITKLETEIEYLKKETEEIKRIVSKICTSTSRVIA